MCIFLSHFNITNKFKIVCEKLNEFRFACLISDHNKLILKQQSSDESKLAVGLKKKAAERVFTSSCYINLSTFQIREFVESSTH